jgi:uncharacterized protein DUF5659
VWLHPFNLQTTTMGEKDEKGMFRTSDLSLASYLRASGVNYSHCQPINPKQVEFCFEDDPRISELAQGFYSQSQALRFYQSLRFLRAQVFATLRGER